jgi:hypothetical protein
MDWGSWIGGSAGLVALIKVGIDIFNARSNRNVVDISNMEKMLHDAMDRYEKLEQKFDKFQKESHTYVESLRSRISCMEGKIQGQEARMNNFEKVVNTAWRCKFPQNIQECPVIAEYEKRHLCAECNQETES